MSDDLSQYHELYLQTSRDLINNMRAQLKVLQENVSDTVAIDEFHRAAHSLKSQSLVMGYAQLGTVNRYLEAFFLQIKEKELQLNEQYLQMVNTIIAHIEHALNDIDKSEHEPDLSDDIRKLQEHTNITS